ncbi:MAG: hypothetical protein ACTSYZ_10875 [Candidatus Helarchaeota archaeon]
MPTYPQLCDGAVVKQSAILDQNLLKFEAPAICFASELDAIIALSEKRISNNSIIIIRYEGPKDGL